MIRLLLLIATMTLTPPKEATAVKLWQMPPNDDQRSGNLSAYAPGVMAHVIAHNDSVNFPGWMGWPERQAAQLDGYIAVAHCNRRGQVATMTTANGRYLVLVVDCLAAEHRTPGNIFDRAGGYVAEVDYKLAERLGVGKRSVYVTLEFEE